LADRHNNNRWRQTHVTTFWGGGGTSLFLSPGAKSPSYTAELCDRQTLQEPDSSLMIVMF